MVFISYIDFNVLILQALDDFSGTSKCALVLKNGFTNHVSFVSYIVHGFSFAGQVYCSCIVLNSAILF